MTPSLSSNPTPEAELIEAALYLSNYEAGLRQIVEYHIESRQNWRDLLDAIQSFLFPIAKLITERRGTQGFDWYYISSNIYGHFTPIYHHGIPG